VPAASASRQSPVLAPALHFWYTNTTKKNPKVQMGPKKISGHRPRGGGGGRSAPAEKIKKRAPLVKLLNNSLIKILIINLIIIFNY